MSAYRAQVEKYGSPIPDEEYKKLRSYAKSHNIKLTDFKFFVGDIRTIQIVIDDICEIAQDFPLLLDKKQGVHLELSYKLGTDFATAVGHIIHLNVNKFLT